MKQLNNRFFAFLLIVVMAFFLGGTSALAEEETAGEYLDNSIITTKVKKAIFDEPTLKSSEIKVETFKGVVQLSGFVSSQNDIDRAAEVAREVEGVKSVKNSLEVKGQ
ncbi:BON domain-containing protein [Nitrosomonas sp. Nm34]|uniref:BON domain-containing protein n=1 Tax=Nitrosomonas sp. Nm34 TaxID=1881055 RepID=UPI0008F3FCFA|nr:BON domain-containing protein [Nitrosomonas sp. Nm34]SFI22178.1 BON domain-containing protein [Nitrosomonas sp. Nm34]